MRAIRRVGLVGLGLALVLSTALAQPQNTVHVDVHAAPGGDGSATAPFQTIQGAIDAGDPTAPLDPDGSRADIGPLPFDASWTPFEVYCTAQVNSLGCTPAIGAEGNASASATVPFAITCSNTLNNRTGLLFYGYGPRATAYQGGFLCVASPVRRTALLDSGGSSTGTDCSGVFAFDFNAHLQSGADPLLEPGVEVFAQFWSRDPGASFPTHRSDALRFAVLP